jgi:hypothetical protein
VPILGRHARVGVAQKVLHGPQIAGVQVAQHAGGQDLIACLRALGFEPPGVRRRSPIQKGRGIKLRIAGQYGPAAAGCSGELAIMRFRICAPLSPPACVRCWWCSAGRWNRAPHAHFRYSARWSASPFLSSANGIRRGRSGRSCRPFSRTVVRRARSGLLVSVQDFGPRDAGLVEDGA